MIKISIAIKCSPSNPNLDYYISVAYLFNNTESANIYGYEHFESSGSVYYYVHLVTTDRSLVFANTTARKWAIAYDISPLLFGFDVAPDESAYGTIGYVGTSLYIYKYGTDSSFQAGYSSTLFTVDSYSSKIQFSADSSSIFMLNYNTTNYRI